MKCQIKGCKDKTSYNYSWNGGNKKLKEIVEKVIKVKEAEQ